MTPRSLSWLITANLNCISLCVKLGVYFPMCITLHLLMIRLSFSCPSPILGRNCLGALPTLLRISTSQIIWCHQQDRLPQVFIPDSKPFHTWNNLGLIFFLPLFIKQLPSFLEQGGSFKGILQLSFFKYYFHIGCGSFEVPVSKWLNHACLHHVARVI